MIIINTPIIPSVIAPSLAVYQHRMNEQCFYVGLCKLVDIFNSPDARQNSEWKRIVTPGTKLQLILLREVLSLEEAKEYQQECILALRPYCNLNGKVFNPATTRVECVNTGEQFATAAEAAKHYMITPGAMSNHLNQRTGYKTLRNMTFRRIVQ